MLIFMHFIFLLRAAHAQPGLNINIVIKTIHVGERMMDNIVLLVSHKTISTQNI